MAKPKKDIPENTNEKEKALQHALDEIHKKYGQGSIMKLGDTDAKLDIGAISTGSISIDMITGIGGVPRGRVVEVYGPESSGKTTLCLHIVAEAQKAGGRAAFIDAEHALDPDYARNLGVDLDELVISQPDYGEQALEIVEMLARSASLDVIVVDSVAALVPKAELDGEMGDVMVGVQARLMSKALRKLAGVANKTGTTLIFINQIREKIGVMWGSPETTVGGRALKFFSSMRIDVRKADAIKNGQDFLGNRTKIKIVKNKVAAPFKTAEVNIIYGKGISKTTDLIDSAIELGIVEKAGAWLVYGETKLQGKDKFESYLESNPEVMGELDNKVRSLVFDGVIL